MELKNCKDQLKSDSVRKVRKPRTNTHLLQMLQLYRTIIASNTIITATSSIYWFYESFIHKRWNNNMIDIECVSCKMHFMLLL